METQKTKKKLSVRNITLLVLSALIVICMLAVIIFLSNGYRAGEQAELTLQADELVDVVYVNHEYIIFGPANTVGENPDDSKPTRGFIFYPGANVEYKAYAPLLHNMAEQGWFCVLTKMPMNMAFFDIDAADNIMDAYPRIDSWYIGGHSLGGAMAASYAAEEYDEEPIDGLILLASYSTADLSKSGLDVYSIYGSEDLVLNREKYRECYSNLPDDTKELVIEGGCHAHFGDYGPQDGDGTPTISSEEQLKATIDFLPY